MLAVVVVVACMHMGYIVFGKRLTEIHYLTAYAERLKFTRCSKYCLFDGMSWAWDANGPNFHSADKRAALVYAFAKRFYTSYDVCEL